MLTVSSRQSMRPEMRSSFGHLIGQIRHSSSAVTVKTRQSPEQKLVFVLLPIESDLISVAHRQLHKLAWPWLLRWQPLHLNPCRRAAGIWLAGRWSNFSVVDSI